MKMRLARKDFGRDELGRSLYRFYLSAFLEGYKASHNEWKKVFQPKKRGKITRRN